jgi:hypothetical protein
LWWLILRISSSPSVSSEGLPAFIYSFDSSFYKIGEFKTCIFWRPRFESCKISFGLHFIA